MQWNNPDPAHGLKADFLKNQIRMMTIYKQLPKTNCGKCGLPTCMAFALKVKKAQADLSGKHDRYFA